MRKIIQIAIEPETENDYGALYALCNDGSLWVLALRPNATWEELQPPTPFGDSKYIVGDDAQMKLGLV